MSWMDLFRNGKPRKEPDATAGSEPPDGARFEQTEVSQQADANERFLAAKRLHQEGRIADAEAIYLRVLEENPEHADARHLVGLACLERGELSEAEQHIRQAIALDSDQAAYHSNLGNVLGAQGRAMEAHECFQQALSLNPRHLGALNNAATALLSMGRASEAEPLCLQVLAIAPEDVGARLNLAAVHLEAHDVHAAIDVLRAGLESQPHDIGLLIQLASALELANQLDDAFATIERADTMQPGIARVSLLSGLIARRLGRLEVAERHLRQALSLGLSQEEETEAFNQLGLCLDAAGKADEAYTAFARSNQIMRGIVGEKDADGSVYLRELEAIRKFFTAERFAALRGEFGTDDDYQPVFFVGFPRSGTTLMEQVLKAHPMLVTTEEVSPLSAVLEELRGAARGYPAGLDDLTRDDLVRLRQYFRDFSRGLLGESCDKQLIDKLPLNIVHLGLAKLLYPNAKIVVALRDPRDVCLSCFMQKFKINYSMANFLDIRSTASAYSSVMGLWLHYRTILGPSWLEYRYESLVNDFDETVSQVLDFVGVGWHDDIAGYREAAKRRAITTPSYRDVAAPLNARALARWRRYEKDLAPILPVLAPFVETFGYEK